MATTVRISALPADNDPADNNSVPVDNGSTVRRVPLPSLMASDAAVSSIISNAQQGTWKPTEDAVPTTIAQNLGWHLNAKHFGARGDGVTDDTAAIRKAVAYLKLIGGGRLYFPAGTYLVHVASPDYSSSTWNAAGILVDFSNLHMFGDGVGSTTLKCLADQDNYCVIHYGLVPIQNGVPAIFNCTLTAMTIDGNNANPAPSLATRSPAIMARGLKNCTFRDLHVKNSGMYGLGLQNGGHQEVTVDNVFFESCGRNAIDVKNNGSVNRGIIFSNVRVRNCGWVDFIDEKSSCISITGVGCQMDNIIIWDIPTTPNSIGQVLRIKPGTEAFSQGVGARATTVNNVQILLPTDAAPPSLDRVIELSCEKPILSNIVIRGKATLGISLQQPGATINGFLIDGPDTGIHLRPKQIADPNVQPYPAGTDSRITNGAFYNCATVGILNNADRTTIMGNYFESCAIGINNLGSGGANAFCFGNRFDDATVTTKIRGDSGTGAFWFGNPGAVNPVFSAVLETNEARNLAITVANTVRIMGDSGNQEIARFRTQTSAVSGLDVYSAATGNPVQLTVISADTNAPIVLSGKNTGYAAVRRPRLLNVPTSSAGLSTGDVWNDTGTLKIV